METTFQSSPNRGNEEPANCEQFTPKTEPLKEAA